MHVRINVNVGAAWRSRECTCGNTGRSGKYGEDVTGARNNEIGACGKVQDVDVAVKAGCVHQVW